MPADPQALRYPLETPPPDGTMQAVADGVFWLRMPLPFALDHINLWLLRDGDGYLLIDTGICRDEVKALWQRVFADAPGPWPVRGILVTHFHPDHLGLAGWLHERTQAPVYITRTEWLLAQYIYNDVDGQGNAQQVRLYQRHGLAERWSAPMLARGNRYRDIISPPPPQHRRLQHGDTLEVDGRDWRVIVGEGHAPEHACLHCPDLDVLIAGDQILPRITPNITLPASQPDSNPLQDFLDTLARFETLDPATLVLPSHGRPFYGLHARIAQLRRHHDEHLRALVDALAEPRTATDCLPLLFRRELDSHQMLFAMGECLSHLACLRARGEVREHAHQGLRYFCRA